MGKCFDGIRRLDFGDDPKSSDISAMVSGGLVSKFGPGGWETRGA